MVGVGDEMKNNIHSGIVNGYKLLCDAHTMPELNRRIEAVLLYYSLSSFSAFFCVCFSL